MNKITFCSYPDFNESKNTYGLKNYNNDTIKHILNTINQEVTFYLLDNVPNEWLNIVSKKVKIIFDCAEIPLTQIQTVCQKK